MSRRKKITTGAPIGIEFVWPGSWGPDHMPIASLGGFPLVALARIELNHAEHAGEQVRFAWEDGSVEARLPSHVGERIELRLDGRPLYYGAREKRTLEVTLADPPVFTRRQTFEIEGVR